MLTCGARTSVAMSATTGIPLATRGGACRSNRVGINPPAFQQPRSEAAARRSRLPCRPPLTTFSPFVQELTVRSRPIGGASTASAIVTSSTVSGAPSNPLAAFFSPGIDAPESPLPSHPDAGPCRPPEHPPRRRMPPPSLFFRSSPSARSSGELKPLPPSPAGGPSTFDARAPNLAPPQPR
jgi:hypothetical protein